MFKTMAKKGAAETSAIVRLIMIVGVSIPIVITTISTANLTGLTAVIVGFIPVFLAIGGLIVATKSGK